jgi:hypothetical protein
MEMKKLFLFGVVAVLLLTIIPGISKGQAKGVPPVITFSWAQDKIRQGEDWRIYLIATDPDNDLYRIYCRVDQPGGQVYRPDISTVKKGMEGKIAGYLVLRTQSLQDLFGTHLTLTLTVVDRSGNESQSVVFPLAINGEKRKSPPPSLIPAGSEKELDQRIAYIGIDLVRRDRMGSGD